MEEMETRSPSGGRKDLQGYVGFANLPNQVHKKSVKKGFEFTLMVVGESGLGKSTLVNSLFLADLYVDREYPNAAERIKQTVEVTATTVDIEEKGVRLRLTVVDTPGFADAVDNTNSWDPIVKYIDDRYQEYLDAEWRVNRKNIQDSRVHCCLYFISPHGHGLKPIDIKVLKELDRRVNIIPIVAKSDTLTAAEIAEFKQRVNMDIEQHKIRIYKFPIEEDDDEETIAEAEALQSTLPFAVVGSNTILDINGKKVRGRKYPWGVVEVENDSHCDFTRLRDMLIRTHMQDLHETTHDVHYENFRAAQLANRNPLEGQVNPMTKLDEERKKHDRKMAKMEDEMESVFDRKVKEKEKALNDSEAEKRKAIEEMQRQLEEQKRMFEEQQRKFLEEKAAYETQHAGGDKDKKKSGLFKRDKE